LSDFKTPWALRIAGEDGALFGDLSPGGAFGELEGHFRGESLLPIKVQSGKDHGKDSLVWAEDREAEANRGSGLGVVGREITRRKGAGLERAAEIGKPHVVEIIGQRHGAGQDDAIGGDDPEVGIPPIAAEEVLDQFLAGTLVAGTDRG
jgi:hypothetical protein